METVVPPSGDPELHLLTDWDIFVDPTRRRKAGVLSVIAHVVLVIALLLVPPSVIVPERNVELARVTPLIEPPPELTQTTPNTRKITKEFKLPDIQPTPRVQIPTGAPSTTRPRAPRPAEVPEPPVRRPTSLPEPPTLEASAPRPEAPPLPTPQIQPVEQPKLPLENVPPPPQPVPPGRGQVPIPNPSVSEAIRQSVRGGAGGGLVVGDLDLGGPAASAKPSTCLPRQACRRASSSC